MEAGSTIADTELKLCKGPCRQRKARSEFCKDRTKADGYCKYCRTCKSDFSRKYRLSDPEYKTRHLAYNRQWKKDNPERTRLHRERNYKEQRVGVLIRSAKSRAKKKKLTFDLDKHRDEIAARLDHGFCELTGVPFEIVGSGSVANAPSIDQIIAGKGYLYSNIRIVTKRINAAMGEFGADSLRSFMFRWILFVLGLSPSQRIPEEIDDEQLRAIFWSLFRLREPETAGDPSGRRPLRQLV